MLNAPMISTTRENQDIVRARARACVCRRCDAPGSPAQRCGAVDHQRRRNRRRRDATPAVSLSKHYEGDSAGQVQAVKLQNHVGHVAHVSRSMGDSWSDGADL
jgi:hypothetical protein